MLLLECLGKTLKVMTASDYPETFYPELAFQCMLVHKTHDPLLTASHFQCSCQAPYGKARNPHHAASRCDQISAFARVAIAAKLPYSCRGRIRLLL